MCDSQVNCFGKVVGVTKDDVGEVVSVELRDGNPGSSRSSQRSEHQARRRYSYVGSAQQETAVELCQAAEPVDLASIGSPPLKTAGYDAVAYENGFKERTVVVEYPGLEKTTASYSSSALPGSREGAWRWCRTRCSPQSQSVWSSA